MLRHIPWTWDGPTQEAMSTVSVANMQHQFDELFRAIWVIKLVADIPLARRLIFISSRSPEATNR